MEPCASVDAQSLISMSLRKIHSSRTQRGGVKLHKNLLVSYVLRNARQLYMTERYAEIYRLQQHEEVMAVCDEIQELHPELEALDAGEGDEQTRDCCSETPATLEPSYYRSCCMEALNCDLPPVNNNNNNNNSSTHCNKTTVLDLDTHVVTTVEKPGYLHQDCCCAPPPLQCAQSPASKKRKADCGYIADTAEELVPGFSHCKRARLEDVCSYPGASELCVMDTSNISNLISIFGSGFSGLVSRQQAGDFEQICSKQALASLGAWTRAIVAF